MRPDVVESREKFLRKMTECGFLRPDNAPTEEAAQALPTDVPHMTKEEGEKCIGGMTRVPVKTHQYFGGRKENYRSSRREKVHHHRVEGWLPGTQ